ncbi:MAG TPA: cytosine permease [Jatrophihabitantaceae bacterium]|jgi:NCS1 family nucleobase:cation symporter-1|nr:cytosine permease [Jatrophihabitantaceae bacterium]
MTSTVDRHANSGRANASEATEVGRTLAEPPPRTLGLLDQLALWGNLGVSLLGPAYAVYVLAPGGTAPLSLVAAFVAVIVGTVVGTLMLSLSAVPGAQTGHPAMVLLRGLFGTRLSYLPTLLNLLQCLGWGIFELVVISTAAEVLLPWHVRWPYVLAAGILTTVMTLRPLGAVRTLRRYAIVAVVLSSVYFFVEFGRHPLPSLSHGSWSGFWLAADAVLAVSVSWVPLAADYSRHSRSAKGAFFGSFVGYTVTQIAYYTLGLLALATVVTADNADHTVMFHAFVAVPFGWLPFAVLVLRELDESFTNVYSTTVSVQNLRPLADRRVLAVVVGTLATLGALSLNISDYQSFLALIGSVFVPMFAVFAVDYFGFGGRKHWDFSERARARWAMLVPWALGFVAYQLVNPGAVSWWVSLWTKVQSSLGFTPQTWMSASVVSFVVAAVATAPVALIDRQRRRHQSQEANA